MLRQIIHDIEKRQQHMHEGKIIRTGMKGLPKRLDPHMLDVARMVERICSTVSDVTIAWCWVKANVLSTITAAMVTTKFGRMGNASKEASVQEMISQLAKVSVDF